MYVKVHKKDDCWYRSDTGDFVGYGVPLKKSATLRSTFGDHFFAKNGEVVFVIYHGYLKQNIFYHFCKNILNCAQCNSTTKNIFCGKKISGGYYIKL